MSRARFCSTSGDFTSGAGDVRLLRAPRTDAERQTGQRNGQAGPGHDRTQASLLARGGNDFRSGRFSRRERRRQRVSSGERRRDGERRGRP